MLPGSDASPYNHSVLVNSTNVHRDNLNGRHSLPTPSDTKAKRSAQNVLDHGHKRIKLSSEETADVLGESDALALSTIQTRRRKGTAFQMLMANSSARPSAFSRYHLCELHGNF